MSIVKTILMSPIRAIDKVESFAGSRNKKIMYGLGIVCGLYCGYLYYNCRKKETNCFSNCKNGFLNLNLNHFNSENVNSTNKTDISETNSENHIEDKNTNATE